MITLEKVANERENLLDRRKFHMMMSRYRTLELLTDEKCIAPGEKMRRPAGKAWWNPEEVVKEVTSCTGWCGP